MRTTPGTQGLLSSLSSTTICRRTAITNPTVITILATNYFVLIYDMSAHWYFGNMGDANGISVQSFGNRTIITLPDNMTIVATGGSVSFTAASNRGFDSGSRSCRGRNRPGPRGPAHANNNNNNNGNRNNRNNSNNNQNQPHNNRGRGRRWQGRRNRNRRQGNRGAPRAIETGHIHVNAAADAHPQDLAPADINTAGTIVAAMAVPVTASAGAHMAMEIDGDWNGNANGTYEPTYDPYRGPTEEMGNQSLNSAPGQEHADHHSKQEGDDWRIITASGYDAGLDFDVSEEFFAGRSGSVATNLMDFTENASTGTL